MCNMIFFSVIVQVHVDAISGMYVKAGLAGRPHFLSVFFSIHCLFLLYRTVNASDHKRNLFLKTVTKVYHVPLLHRLILGIMKNVEQEALVTGSLLVNFQ